MLYSPVLHPPEPIPDTLPFSRTEHSYSATRTPLTLAICLLLTLVALMPLPASADALNLWPGENNSLDTIGSDHAQVQGEVSYINAKIGQAFAFTGSGFLEMGNISGFTPDAFTFDLWIKAELNPWFHVPVLNMYYRRGDTSVSIAQDGGLCGRIEWRHGGCTFGSGPQMFKSGEPVILDEIRYHAHPMTDEEVFALYNNYIVSYPDEALLAELDAAYALIESLQQEVESLNQANTDLEYQIISLESQNTIYISQINDLEAQLSAMADRVSELESRLGSLETQVNGLEQQVADLQQQIAELKAMVGNLESQVLYLEEKVRSLQAELNALKQTLNLSLTLLEEDFRATFRDPLFEIPGSDPEEQLENLVQAIIGLNKGRKMGLYKALRHSDRRHPKDHSLLWWLQSLQQYHQGRGGHSR